MTKPPSAMASLVGANKSTITIAVTPVTAESKQIRTLVGHDLINWNIQNEGLCAYFRPA
jgi:hypothetical protein